MHGAGTTDLTFLYFLTLFSEFSKSLLNWEILTQVLLVKYSRLLLTFCSCEAAKETGWLYLTAWTWGQLYQCGIAFWNNWGWIKRHTFVYFFKSLPSLRHLNLLLVIWYETPSRLYILIQRAHTPHSVCSYIFPHGALSPLGTPWHTHLHTSLKLSHTWQQIRVMLVLESKDAHLYFFPFLLLKFLNTRRSSGIRTIL